MLMRGQKCKQFLNEKDAEEGNENQAVNNGAPHLNQPNADSLLPNVVIYHKTWHGKCERQSNR